MNYNFTEDDIKFVEKAVELKNKGYYIDGNQLTEVYNRILNKRVNTTSCGSCLRQRISELEGALNHYKAKEAIQSQLNCSNETLQTISSPSDSVEEVEVDNVKEDKNKSIRKKK